MISRFGLDCSRAALQDKVLEPTLGSQIESECSPGRIAFDAGFGGQCKRFLGSQRGFGDDLQAAKTQPQVGQAVQ
ncbi:MAG: hypothetical protein AW09_001926 [Candidatus Accumulibacter phosphatis]|uniref:Uncharacterized protein n=1 Tax=Candidatus Accumulibacter phosphatis TaxID=327160 RepID=A0A080LW36_9PROT|nr:MAG: hypothetical protein AW09_001926 [Candidatus Accumulibacter phosphatis]